MLVSDRVRLKLAREGCEVNGLMVSRYSRLLSVSASRSCVGR